MIPEGALQQYCHLNWLFAEGSKFLCFMMAVVTSGTKGSQGSQGSQRVLTVDEAWKDD